MRAVFTVSFLSSFQFLLPSGRGMSVILETTIGDLTVDLYCEERPICSKNFLKLCKVKYYNFCLFHSVQKNSVAQTGDPTGKGTGGESIFAQLYGEQAKTFEMEIKPRIKHRKRGQASHYSLLRTY